VPRRGPVCSLFAILMVALVILAGCSRLERLNISLSHGVDRRLQHKEIVRIDEDVYVKVRNPNPQGGDVQGPWLHVLAKDYLANPESYDTVVTSAPTPKEDEWKPVELKPTVPMSPGQEPSRTEQVMASLHLKKRLMLVPFEDLSKSSHKGLSDIVMRSLALKIQGISDQVILINADIMKDILEDGKPVSESFDSPEMIRLAKHSGNIHAIVMGTINHVFTSSLESKVRGKGKTAYAIAEINARLIDTASGRIRRQWGKRNPLFEAEGKGEFSEEKAQLRAFDLIASELGQDIIEELKRLDWYATIASVDGNRVYVSAGKLSGVRVGDVFSVYPAAFPSEPKGEIRIAGLFGIDASVGDITKGKDFRVNDLVRPIFR